MTGSGACSTGASSSVETCVAVAWLRACDGAAAITLSCPDDYLTFTVIDDGTGFDTTTATHGTGVQGMADRLAALGGAFQIQSKPGLGTTVTGTLPISELAEPDR